MVRSVTRALLRCSIPQSSLSCCSFKSHVNFSGNGTAYFYCRSALKSAAFPCHTCPRQHQPHNQPGLLILPFSRWAGGGKEPTQTSWERAELGQEEHQCISSCCRSPHFLVPLLQQAGVSVTKGNRWQTLEYPQPHELWGAPSPHGEGWLLRAPPPSQDLHRSSSGCKQPTFRYWGVAFCHNPFSYKGWSKLHRWFILWHTAISSRPFWTHSSWNHHWGGCNYLFKCGWGWLFHY